MSAVSIVSRHRPGPARLVRTACAAAIVIATASSSFAQAGGAAGLHVSGSTLLTASGKPFVMRGINVLNAAAASSTPQALVDIAATGANAVRLTVTGAPNADGSTLKSLQTI